MANKILYVCQEITPYLPETEESRLCRSLIQAMQERGNEIRTFMPRYGCINERRHQLHEVIRLSGMNLIIDDNDHQLIIKVASIPAARVQIYLTTIAARLMAFEMLICHKSGNDMPCIVKTNHPGQRCG